MKKIVLFVVCFSFLFSNLLISKPKSKKEQEYIRNLLQQRIEDSKKNGILDLSKLQIKSLDGIQSALGSTCKKIKEIRMDHNKIKKIERDDLNRFRNLEILDLSFNKISEIEKGAFAPLKKLVRLDLSNNKIKELQPQIFMNQRKLKDLDLSDNDIKILKRDLFRNLSALEQINLADNKITHIPVSLFKRNKKIKEIYLAGNKVPALNEGLGKRDWTQMIQDLKVKEEVLDLWGFNI
ncbi:MAG: leucine-rich repeat domain-containing protein [bacterium]